MTVTLIMSLAFIQIPECFIDRCRIVTTLQNTVNTVTFNQGNTQNCKHFVVLSFKIFQLQTDKCVFERRFASKTI